MWWPGRKPPADETPAEPVVQEISGPAHVVSDAVDTSGYVAGDVEAELAKLVEAVREVDAFLTGLGLKEARYTEVFRTQNAILHDITWMRTATREITRGAPATAAALSAFADVSGMFDAIVDSTLKERGTDVRSMSRLVRSALVGAPLRRPEPDAPSVWIVDELDAATAMQLTDDNCVGVAATSDLVSGHGIEIATGRGFRCVTGRDDAANIDEGDPVSFG